MPTEHPLSLRMIKAAVAIWLILVLAPLAGANDKNRELMQAAEKGQLEEVTRLLNEGADVNAKDQQGKTALILAASKGQLPVTKLLLDKGADVNAKDDNKATAIL